MNIEELKIEDFAETISAAIQHKTDCILYSIIPANIVYSGKGDIDCEYCRQHNYLVYNSIDFGNGLVATKGDVVLVVICKDGWLEHKRLSKVMIDYLRTKGLDVSLKSNDIMIDDFYKVASYSSVNIGDNVIYTGFQATFNPNITDIECICKKPCSKTPKGLSDYNISADELLSALLKLYDIQQETENATHTE